MKMNHGLSRAGWLAAVVAAMGMTTGCAAFRASTTSVDLDSADHMKADFDYVDMRKITEEVVADILRGPFVEGHDSTPILIVAGVENRTSNYVDTKALTDRMRTLLLQSGKVQFINESRRADLMKEQGYQAANATPDTQVAIGRQLGASYMVSGSLVEMSQTSPRQVRVSKQEVKYYNLTMEITDLETGLITWTTEKEFARQASKPLIGW